MKTNPYRPDNEKQIQRAKTPVDVAKGHLSISPQQLQISRFEIHFQRGHFMKLEFMKGTHSLEKIQNKTHLDIIRTNQTKIPTCFGQILAYYSLETQMYCGGDRYENLLKILTTILPPLEDRLNYHPCGSKTLNLKI